MVESLAKGGQHLSPVGGVVAGRLDVLACHPGLADLRQSRGDQRIEVRPARRKLQVLVPGAGPREQHAHQHHDRRIPVAPPIPGRLIGDEAAVGSEHRQRVVEGLGHVGEVVKRAKVADRVEWFTSARLPVEEVCSHVIQASPVVSIGVVSGQVAGNLERIAGDIEACDPEAVAGKLQRHVAGPAADLEDAASLFQVIDAEGHHPLVEEVDENRTAPDVVVEPVGWSGPAQVGDVPVLHPFSDARVEGSAFLFELVRQARLVAQLRYLGSPKSRISSLLTIAATSRMPSSTVRVVRKPISRSILANETR